jgi:hypothetical protein
MLTYRKKGRIFVTDEMKQGEKSKRIKRKEEV